MATITVGGHKLWVEDAFNDLSPQAQADAVGEIASRLQGAAASAPFGFAPPPPQGAGAPDSFAQRFQPALDQPLAIFNPPMPRPRPAEASGAAAPQTGAPDPRSAEGAGVAGSFAQRFQPKQDQRLPWWATGPAAALQPGAPNLQPGQGARPAATSGAAAPLPADEDRLIVGVESGGDPKAKNPRSSATGAGQFVAGTWLDVLKRHRPDLANGLSREEQLALRMDPALSREMVGYYREDNQATLRRAGFSVTPGTTYLAHFAGPTGALNILKADPSTPASSVLNAGTMKSNPQIANMNAGEVIAWADHKMAAEAARAARTAPAAAPSPPAWPGSSPMQPFGAVPQGNRPQSGPVPQVTPFGWGLPNWRPPQ